MTGECGSSRAAASAARRAAGAFFPGFHSRAAAHALHSRRAPPPAGVHTFPRAGGTRPRARAARCSGAALLLLPERLRRDAARGSHAAGAHVARTVHTCCASVGLHTLRSVVRPGNAAEPSAASRERFVSAAAKGDTRKRSANQREMQSTAVCEVQLPFSDFGKHEARRPQHDTAPLQLFAHTGTLTQPPPASHSADAIIMREMLRTHAPGKQSAPGMKTLEGSEESARVSSRGRLATSLRGGVAFVPCEVAEGSELSSRWLGLASCQYMPVASSCIKRFDAFVGERLGFGDEDFPRPRRTARPLG